MEHPEQNPAEQEPVSGEQAAAKAYEAQPTPEERKQQDTRKKWFWGCGGCLIALILIVAVLGFLSVGVFNKLQEGSTGATRAIFGDNPPVGYLAVGAQLPPQTGVHNLVLLMNQNNQRQMLFAFDSTVTPQQMALLKQGKATEEGLGNLLQGMLQGAPADGGGVQVDKLRIDAVSMASLPEGRGQYPVVSAKIEDDQTFIPTVTALLPHANNRLVGLVGLDLATKSPDAAADFSSSYQLLQGAVQGIVTETDLDDTAVLK